MASNNKIWVFSLEPLETRYTGEWYDYVPQFLRDHCPNYEVVNVSGVQNTHATTAGAFLNFADTNYWKSSQLMLFLRNLERGLVGDNDHIVFTDAWNPAILQLRYIADLMGKNWVFHGLWHAGSYDPHDFLGRKIGSEPWVRHTEKAMFNAFSHNYFATDFHIGLFARSILMDDNNNQPLRSAIVKTLIREMKIVKTGWPMGYVSGIKSYEKKKNLILFPHRIAPEKQLNIFKDLAEAMPEYKFVVCQEEQLTRAEYHKLLNQAKMVFSANLQETLGISTCAEGPVCGAIPFAPNRLSYSEIFKGTSFLYRSQWTESYDAYLTHKPKLVAAIKQMMCDYATHKKELKKYVDRTMPAYFEANELVRVINLYE